MKKIYFTSCLAFLWMAGHPLAQNAVVDESNSSDKNTLLKKEEPVFKKGDPSLVKNNDKPASVREYGKDYTDAANGVIEKTDEPSTNSNEVAVKKIITKAQWEIISESRREYIRTHPELYTIEK